MENNPEQDPKKELPKMSDPVLVEHRFKGEDRFLFGLVQYPKRALLDIYLMSVASCVLVWGQVYYFQTVIGLPNDKLINHVTFIPSVILLLVASRLRDARSYKRLCELFRREPLCVDMAPDELDDVLMNVYRKTAIYRMISGFTSYFLWFAITFWGLFLFFF